MMKKFTALALVLLFATGMSFAEETKVDFTGNYRVEMYDMNNLGHRDDEAYNRDYIDQRLRIRMKFTPEDDVHIHFSADYGETTWGNIVPGPDDPNTDATEGPGGIGYRANQGAGTMMLDRAYMEIKKSIFHFKAGLMADDGFGHAMSTDDQATQFDITASFEPVDVRAVYRVHSEGVALTDDARDDDSDKDETMIGGEVTFNADPFRASGFYATKNDESEGDVKNVLGLFGDYARGNFFVWGEVDMYSGSNDETDKDYVGTNIAFAARTYFGQQLIVGLDIFYAPGNDEDNKDQISRLSDNWMYIPLDEGLGPFRWVQSTGINVHEVEADAGSQGFSVMGKYAVTEAIDLWANVGYVTPSLEDPDDNDIYVSSYTVYNIALEYDFLSTTSFNLAYQSVGRSGENIEDETMTRLMAMFKVIF